MRRMIPGKLIDSVKKLSTSVSADGKGNLEVGKDLEVDGTIYADGKTLCLETSPYFLAYCYVFDSISRTILICGPYGYWVAKDADDNYIRTLDDMSKLDPTNTLKTEVYYNVNSYFNHSLTIKTGSGDAVKAYYVDVTLTTNNVIDSPQDLTTYLGSSKKVGIGTAQLAYDSTAKIWKVGTESVTSVADSVTII